LPGQHC